MNRLYLCAFFRGPIWFKSWFNEDPDIEDKNFLIPAAFGANSSEQMPTFPLSVMENYWP